MKKIRVVHYINQFFANIGGEEKADIPPEIIEGPIGPGQAFANVFGEDYEIVATVICGDNYFGENIEKASAIIIEMIKPYQPDLFIAGPAFNAGRYGVACGTICKQVQKELKIPVITGMYEENPGVDMFRKDLYIIKTSISAASMRNAVKDVVELSKKLIGNDEIQSPLEENYHERGIRVNYFNERRGSERAIDVLLDKIAGREFTTEYPMPVFDRVAPVEPIKDLKTAKIAIVTSGGIVPQNNPDRIESSSASKYGIYSIKGMDTMSKDDFMSIHGGYDRAYVNENINLVVPLDVLKEMEKEKIIGEVADFIISTTGTGTSVQNSKRFAEEFTSRLIEEKVDAVILTSTWGTCTRCGATMVKEIERAGIPVVHACTVVPISLTIGANRIVPTIGIPYPFGDPNLGEEKSKKIRRKLVETCLRALQTPIKDQSVFEAN